MGTLRRLAGRRWIMLGLLAAAVLAAGGGGYLYLEEATARDLRDAIADTDRLDPGWRFPDLEAARAVVPDAENSAPLVRAAHARIMAVARPVDTGNTPTLSERIAGRVPTAPVDDTDRAELRQVLAQNAPMLDIARKLADRPRGRFAVAWSADLIATPGHHVHEVLSVERLLALDALGLALDGDAVGARRSCRAALNAGRALGDEPTGIAQIIRAGSAVEAVRALERVLAQVQPNAAGLEEMQHLLADEAETPYLLRAACGERVAYFEPLDQMRTGRFNRAIYRMQPSRLGERWDTQVDAARARGSQAAYLRFTTALVEITKLPPEVQEERLRQLAVPTQQLPALIEGMMKGSDWVRQARTYRRAQAVLRCVVAALAAERFRLAAGHWPETLDALVPRYLGAVPSDPFDGRPLRLHRRPDGVTIYSVHANRTDDGGNLLPGDPEAPGSDIGFRLWEPKFRGPQPLPE